MKKRIFKTRAYLVIILMLAFSIIAWILSYQLYQKRPGIAEAGMFPLLMSSLMVIFLLVALFRVPKESEKAEEKKEKGDATPMNISSGRVLLEALKEEFPVRTVLLGGCILGYGILFHFTGFYISTGIFLMISMTGLYKGKKILQSVLITAGTLVFMYLFIEKLFHIPLP